MCQGTDGLACRTRIFPLCQRRGGDKNLEYKAAQVFLVLLLILLLLLLHILVLLLQ